MIVDLPAPFSPSSAWKRPASSLRSIPRSATVAPKIFVRSRSSRRATPPGGASPFSAATAAFRSPNSACADPDASIVPTSARAYRSAPPAGGSLWAANALLVIRHHNDGL